MGVDAPSCLRLSFGAFAVDTEESARRGQHQKTWQMAMLVCCLGKLDRRVQTAETMSIYCLRHEARTGQIAKNFTAFGLWALLRYLVQFDELPSSADDTGSANLCSVYRGLTRRAIISVFMSSSEFRHPTPSRFIERRCCSSQREAQRNVILPAFPQSHDACISRLPEKSGQVRTLSAQS